MYVKTITRRTATAWAVLAVVLLAALPVPAAVLDVCATCTHTDVESAVAAAAAGDTIILDGPTVLTDPPTTYTLSAGIVIDGSLDGLTIRGRSDSRPDLIEVELAGAEPVITVEQNAEFRAVGFTIKGGSMGISAMPNSTVDVDRCLIDGASGIGVNCNNVDSMTLKSTIIANCGAQATRLDTGGRLNIMQCSFVFNGDLGVDAVAGLATVEATLIHDSDDGTNGISGTSGTLSVAGNWVTDSGTNPLPLPAGVTDAFEVTDNLDPGVVFDPASYPAKIANVAELRRTGEPESSFALDALSTDFANRVRLTTDIAVGADEEGAGGLGANWNECYIYQNGQITAYVGEGEITVEVGTNAIDLTGAVLFFENSTGASVDIEFLGPYLLEVGTVDTGYGVVDIPIIEDDFIAAFPTATDIQAPYRIYIDTNGGVTPNVGTLYGSPTGIAEDPNLVESRLFELDTEPPTIVTDFDLLADQYLNPPSDDSALDPGPAGWGAGALLGNVGANAGHINGQGADPQVFFDDDPTDNFGFTIDVTFTDTGSGFAVDNLPSAAVSTTPDEKYNTLYVTYEEVPGMAWWDVNPQSQTELITSPANLNVTYANVGGNQLDATWSFSGLVHDGVTQWHAIANIQVMDRAGNIATLDPSFASFIPFKPLHLWWFPGVAARIKSGPSGASTASPTFTWGMERLAGGQDPNDPFPCPPAARWCVWRAQSPGTPGTPWLEIVSSVTGSVTWSRWMDPVLDGVITLDTYFDDTYTLRDIIEGSGGAPGDEYLLAVVGYDEAGNRQPEINGNQADAGAFISNGIAFNRWTDPGEDFSLGLDTRVQPTFWHNNTDSGLLREIDGNERIFGAVSRIPLPDPGCVRVEGAFTVDLALPSSAASVLRYVVYDVFEDGRRVVRGSRELPAGQTQTTFVFPEDIINPPTAFPPGIDTLSASPLAFLNPAPPGACAGDQDRLGDDGDVDAEPPARRRNVKYQVRFATALTPAIVDESPATVEFTVTAGSGTRATDQPIKRFKRE